jgi:O-antigen ligase
LVFAIGGSAFAFGSVELWAQGWLRFTGLLALTVILWRVPIGEVLGGRAGRLALPVAGIIVCAIVQTIPLPRGVVAAISPRAAEIHRATVPPDEVSLPEWLLAKAREEGVTVTDAERALPVPDAADDAAVGRSLSIFPHATRRAALSWATPLLFFLVAAWIARSELARYRLLWGIAWWTGLLGLVAVAQHVTWNGKILWLRPAPGYTQPLGPFVNPTQFAAFVELGTLVTIGLGLAVIGRARGRLDVAALRSAILDREWSLPRLLTAGSLCILGVTGIVLSRSEGAWVAFGAGLGFLLLGRRMWRAAMILPALVVGLGLTLGLTRTLGPSLLGIESEPVMSTQLSASFAVRLDSWSRTFDTFLDFPVAGTGLATFPWAFPAYRRPGEWLVLEETHNDYLQLLSETGTVGLLLLAWGVWAYTRRILGPALADASRRGRWTTLATGAAVLAMLVHSIGDFNLQAPANAVLFSTLVGVLTASASDVPADPDTGAG